MEGVERELNRVSLDIAELYSPHQVTEEAKAFGLQVGDSLDLSKGWNFRHRAQRDQVWEHIREHSPKLVIGSPMCATFSPRQRMNRWDDHKQRRWHEDRQH